MHCSTIAATLDLTLQQVQNTLDLLNSGATTPFIARYRKEATGSLDEVAIAAIEDQFHKLEEIDKRRRTIVESLEKNELLSNELARKIEAAATLTELEDIYLPYRPKRKTRALIARAKGLEELGGAIYEGQENLPISSYLKNATVADTEEALAGARDIIAENIAEHGPTRDALRQLFVKEGRIVSTVVKKMEEQGNKYKDYFDWQEPAAVAPGHRLLAMFRGEREKVLHLSLAPPPDSSLRLIARLHLKPGRWQRELSSAIEDSYKRLLGPSLENEFSANLKSRAEDEAIEVFCNNLRQLLLAPPLGQKRVLAIDPGYRTGAKVVCLDQNGRFLETTTIFPTFGGARKKEAENEIRRLVATHAIEAVGIGNGTAGRETEMFIRELRLGKDIVITMVNEDGASIYSASAIAREEFGDQDITVRGAISIGRRLQDPLAELVKIDPKSIGVGQYQHDVNQAKLKRALDRVVEHCVNSVGVELNSASAALLVHVAGLGTTLAHNIIDYRNENGPFGNRKELLKVSRLGNKAFEQCAGFLRIRTSTNPLDASGVHPERYPLVETMARDLGVSVKKLLASPALIDSIDLDRYTSDSVGLPTLKDIVEELAKPGRDPRQEYQNFRFDESIHCMEDLQEGMILPAIITNITRFGAFADIGIKQDGLIHISQLADRFVKDPGEVVKLGQQVKVRVEQIDNIRRRISLSMKNVK